MNHERSVLELRERRKWRVRKRLHGTAERPRLSVFRSHRHVYVQLIDDETGRTLASAGSLDAAVRDGLKYGGNKDAAQAIGRLIAERAKEKGITQACFDRGPYQYHGRVAALADAAREAGLQF